MTLNIDPEFKSLIPPLTAEERAQLEANIIADGCLDSIKLWNGTILDGHNRYEICTVNGLTFKIEEIPIDSREDAIIWICKNQMGRRNVTDEQKTYLMGKEQSARKNKKGQLTERDESGKFQSGTYGESKKKTAQIVADEHGVGYGTVIRAEEFAKGLDAIGEAEPELKAEILSGKSGAIKKDIQAIAKIPESERPAAIEKIKRGERVTPNVEPPREISPVNLDDAANTIDGTFQEFVDTLDTMLDMYRDLIDTDPKRISTIFGIYITTLNEMKESIK